MKILKFKKETIAPNKEFPNGAIKFITESGFIFSIVDINDSERMKTIESLPYLLECFCELCGEVVDMIPGAYKTLGDLKELTEEHYNNLLK